MSFIYDSSNYQIFIKMQPLAVEMIHCSCTTLFYEFYCFIKNV